MENKTLLRLILAIGILLASGYTIHKYTSDDSEPNYLCESKLMLKHCDRLSSSERRCYPISGSTRGYKDCYEGWELIEPVEEIEPVISYNTKKSDNARQWQCDTISCVEI